MKYEVYPWEEALKRAKADDKRNSSHDRVDSVIPTRFGEEIYGIEKGYWKALEAGITVVDFNLNHRAMEVSFYSPTSNRTLYFFVPKVCIRKVREAK